MYRARCALLVGFASASFMFACGSDAEVTATSAADRPTLVVTTSILGDVVENLVLDEFDVVTIMPVGSDPHDFQASAQQVAQITAADALIVNGAGFEAGLLDVIESAEADGTIVFETINAVSTLEFGEEEHHDKEEEHHDDEHDEHGRDGVDPHFFADPARMAVAATAIVDFLVENVDGLDAATLTESAVAYTSVLEQLDQQMSDQFEAIPEAQRVLVTNHEVFGYFAERYGFEVVGAVIPGGTTADGVNPRELAELADRIKTTAVPAIFADTSASDDLARTLADEVGDVEVVALYSESLGPTNSDGGTYVDMMRTNASRIAAALAG